MASSFNGKVYILTGGASSVGLATLHTLLVQGASCALWDINNTALDKINRELDQDTKRRCIQVVVDVTNRKQVLQAFYLAKGHFGKIDGVVNAAGIGANWQHNGAIHAMGDTEYDFIMNLNVRGCFNVLATALEPGMMREPGGSFVHVASMYAQRGLLHGAVFAASHHAAAGLVKSAAMEVGARGIRVNSVLPGGVEQPMLRYYRDSSSEDSMASSTPIPRLGQAQEVTNVIVFLLGDGASYVTGAEYRVDGGANV